MKKSQRIQTIVDIKAQQEAKALKNVGAQQFKVQAAQQQREQLLRYRQDYLDNDADKPLKRVQSLLDFRAFIAKLDQAIATQDSLIEQLQKDLAQKQAHWEQLHHNTKNLQKVCNGLLATESKIEQKREQIESDDRASRTSRNH